MDYDDNDSQGHNRNLAGEERSKSSTVLHSYDALPKFNFDDSLQSDTRVQNLVEDEGFLVTDTCVKPVEGLLVRDIPQRTMEEQNIRSTESNMVDLVSGRTEGGQATCDLQMEGCKTDNVSVESPQQCIVEVLACNEGQAIYKPLQDFLGDSSVTCPDDKNQEHTLEVMNTDVGISACTELDVIGIEEEKCHEIQVDRLETAHNIEVVNTKAESSSCKELFVDSIADEKFEKHMDRGPFSEVAFLPDVDHKLAERREESGISNARDSYLTVSSTRSGVLSEQPSSIEDSSNMKTPGYLEEDITPEAQTSPLVLGEHMPLSKNNIPSEQNAVHSCEEDVPLHESGNAKFPKESMCSDESSKANVLIPRGSEFDKSRSTEPGVKAAEEVQLSSCDSLSGLPLLSGLKGTADGVTLRNQGQKLQVADRFGLEDLSQVATDIEPVRLSESGQGTDIAFLGKEAECQGCSTKLEACYLPFDIARKHVEGTGASMHKSDEEIVMERKTEVLLHVADDNQASVSLTRPSKYIADCPNKDGIAYVNLVKENPDPPSIISFPDTPVTDNEQQFRIKEVPIESVQHPEATPNSDGKVHSVSHMQHDHPKEEKSFTFEVRSSTGLSEGETIRGGQSFPSIQGHKRSTDAKEYPLAFDCSQIVLLKLPEASCGSPEAPRSVLPKTHASAKVISVRKIGQGFVKTSATSEKIGHVQETSPVKQFEGVGKSMMFLDCHGIGHLVQFEEFKPSGNAEQSGSNACGSLPIPISDLPDLNTVATPAAYLHQPFTYLQQVQLRAQILVHRSLMQDSVPDEACMVSAFGPSDVGRNSWEPLWRACSERVHSPKSHPSNLNTPSQLRSGSRYPIEHSSCRSTSLWDVSSTCESSSMPSRSFDPHQPFAQMQPRQAAGIRSFVGHSPSWSHAHFPGQWVAPQTYALGDNVCVPSIDCVEAVKIVAPEVSYVPNHPTIKQASDLSVSTGVGGAIVSSRTSYQTSANKATVLSGQQLVNRNPTKGEKLPAPEAAVNVPTTFLAQNLPEMRSSVFINSIVSTSKSATNPYFASPSSSDKYLAAVSPISLSDEPIGVNSVLEKKSIVSVDMLDEVETAKIQAKNASAHAVAAVSICNDVWSQLTQLKTSCLRSDIETNLSSAAMVIAAAASAAKAAAAATKLASDVAFEAKLMVDEVSDYSQSTGISISCACDGSRDIASSPVVKEGKISNSSIVAAAKERVMNRAEAASAASKHAENMEAKVIAAELAAEAVSQAKKIGNGDHISGTVTSTEKNSSRTQRASGTVRALEMNSRTVSDVLISGDAPKTSSGTLPDSEMTEGSIVEVSRDSGNYKEAWYSAKILNMKDGKAFVCYTELQADGGKLMEWVPLKGDGTKAPRIRNAHPTTTMCFDGNKKRQRAAVMDYTWCVGDRVDAWVHNCWLEGVVKEKHKNDETTITISFPALRNSLHVRAWHLRPSLTWQDGKWIEWPRASGQSTTQFDAQGKRAKLGHTAVKLVESKKHDNKPKILRSGKSQSASGRALPQKVSSIVSAKYAENATASQENISSQLDLMEFRSVSDSQDTSEGPSLASSKGLPKVSRKKVPSSNAKFVSMSSGKLAAAGGRLRKKVELQDKSFSQASEPRRSNRIIQPTSRLLEGLQSS